MGLVETLRVGCVRFDAKAPGEYEVNLYLKPLYCGRGLGKPLLTEAIRHLRKHRDVHKVYARMEKFNPSSAKLFRSVGFEVHEEDGVLFCEMNLERSRLGSGVQK